MKDFGPGMTNEEQKQLFTPFLNIRPGELQRGRGSGLGLSICREIITLHKGTIGCVSKVRDSSSTMSGGSEFYFNIEALTPEQPPSLDNIDEWSTKSIHGEFGTNSKEDHMPTEVILPTLSNENLIQINTSFDELQSKNVQKSLFNDIITAEHGESKDSITVKQGELTNVESIDGVANDLVKPLFVVPATNIYFNEVLLDTTVESIETNKDPIPSAEIAPKDHSILEYKEDETGNKVDNTHMKTEINVANGAASGLTTELIILSPKLLPIAIESKQQEVHENEGKLSKEPSSPSSVASASHESISTLSSIHSAFHTGMHSFSRGVSNVSMTSNNPNAGKHNEIQHILVCDGKLDKPILLLGNTNYRDLDVLSNRKMLEMLLKRKGYACDQSVHGQDAIDHVLQYGFDYYDIIFMDSVMPILVSSSIHSSTG